MIVRLEFQNFKVLRNVAVDLERFTVIVGPNGCGKSSVLEAVQAITRLGKTMPGEERDPLHRVGAVFQGRMALDGLFSLASAPKPLSPALAFRAFFHDERFVHLERQKASTVSLRFGKGTSPEALRASEALMLPRQNGRSIEEPSKWLTRLAFLPTAVVFTPVLDRLREPAPVDGSLPRLGPDGSGLARVLNEWMGNREPCVEPIERDMGEILGRNFQVRTRSTISRQKVFEPIEVERQQVPRWVERDETRFQLELNIGGQGWIPADHASDGTLYALCLLAFVHGPGQPDLLLIDDIDRGLHPSAQARLFAALKAVLERKPELQVLCTSHSPYLLDQFAPEQVRVMSLDDDGYAVCRKLTEHPDFPQWREVMRAGEFWSSTGEAWVGR